MAGEMGWVGAFMEAETTRVWSNIGLGNGPAQGMERLGLNWPGDLDFAVLGDAVTKVKIDQALIGNTGFCCHGLEINNHVLG